MSPGEIAELMAYDKEDFPESFPLSYPEIVHRQNADAQIKKLLREKPQEYKNDSFRRGDKNYELVTKDNKIVVPKAMQKKVVEWYHHSGGKTLKKG